MNETETSKYAQVWESIGRTNAYYGVLSMEQYRSQELSGEQLDNFFKSGEGHISHILEMLRLHFDLTFEPDTIIDFGCGVGRLTLPLGKACKHVIGVDISSSMIARAKAHCERAMVDNVSFVNRVEEIDSEAHRVNLIASSIVFQHIPEVQGLDIFRKLLSILRPGGMFAIYVLYGSGSMTRSVTKEALEKDPCSLIEMHSYDLNAIFQVLDDSRIAKAYTELIDMGHMRGMNLFGQKQH